MHKCYKALTNLNVNRARVAALDQQIPKLRNLAEKLQQDTYLATSRLGDPTSHIHAEGSFADTTARQGSRIDLPDDVKQLLDDIRALTIERHRTTAWIELAESALDFLKGRDRMMVQLRAVEGMSWTDVVDAYFDQTGEMISDKAARRSFDRALTKIEPFFCADSASGITEKRLYAKGKTA